MADARTGGAASRIQGDDLAELEVFGQGAALPSGQARRFVTPCDPVRGSGRHRLAGALHAHAFDGGGGVMARQQRGRLPKWAMDDYHRALRKQPTAYDFADFLIISTVEHALGLRKAGRHGR